MTTASWRNWGGNQTARPQVIVQPRRLHELRGILADAAENDHRVKAVGSGHSFTSIAGTDGVLVDIAGFAEVIGVDLPARQIRVGAGIPLHELNRQLQRFGLALPNLGDIDAQTVAGATSTGTHGTGAGFNCISAAIVAARLLIADGSHVSCSPHEHPEIFDAVRVGLGALGIVTEVTLQCELAFNLHASEQTVAIDQILDDFDDLTAANEHVEFFWFPNTQTGQLKVNNRTDLPIARRGRAQAFVADELVSNTGFDLLQRIGRRRPGVVASTVDRLLRHGETVEYVAPSAEVFCSPRRVRFIEMEYALPREHLLEAFGRVREIADALDVPVGFPIEARVLAGDDIPLSMASGRHSAFLAVHVYHRATTSPYFERVEDIMNDYGGRPHWGKLHTRTAADLAPLYPRWEDFAKVRDQLDPARRFTNPYLAQVFGS